MEVGELQKCAFKAMFPAAIADFRPFRSSQVCQEPVVVLSVERYPRDPGSGGGLWEAPGGGDLYDLSLSEGHCRLRAVLQPSLNWMVRRNLLSSGCELSEVRLGLQYDERRLGVGVQVFVLLEAQVVSTGGCGATPAVRRLKPQKLYVFNEGTELPFGPELPIKAKRRYYLPLWDTVDYNGEAWHRHPPGQPIQQFEVKHSGVKEIAGMSFTYSGQEVGIKSDHIPVTRSCSIDVRLLEGYTQQKKKDLPPVIVRILRKFRLYHFGRPDKYSECPFQAKFLVADKSGSATLVLWNSLCMDWYRHLEPGMVVRLHNYVVKKSYTTRMGHHPEVSNEPALDESKEGFYATLDTTLNNILKGDKIILLGNFTARVGKEGVGNCNSSCRQLLDRPLTHLPLCVHHMPSEAAEDYEAVQKKALRDNQTGNLLTMSSPKSQELILMWQKSKSSLDTKNGKATEVSGIPVEIFKLRGAKLTCHPHRMFLKIWDKEEIPANLRHAAIVTIFKKYENDNVSEENLQALLDAFVEAYQRTGFSLNLKKTQSLYQPVSVTINGEGILQGVFETVALSSSYLSAFLELDE
eukprot:g47056.t1